MTEGPKGLGGWRGPVGVAKNPNLEYARALREFADKVEHSDVPLDGAYVLLFWHNGHITRIGKHEPGFHLLSAAGLFLQIANELAAKQVVEGFKPVDGG